MRKSYIVSVLINDGVKSSEIQAAIRDALEKLGKVTIRPAQSALEIKLKTQSAKHRKE